MPNGIFYFDILTVTHVAQMKLLNLSELYTSHKKVACAWAVVSVTRFIWQPSLAGYRLLDFWNHSRLLQFSSVVCCVYPSSFIHLASSLPILHHPLCCRMTSVLQVLRFPSSSVTSEFSSMRHSRMTNTRGVHKRTSWQHYRQPLPLTRCGMSVDFISDGPDWIGETRSSPTAIL